MTGVLLPVLAIAALFTPQSDAVTPTVCEAILVRTGEHGIGTTLSSVSLPGGAERVLHSAPIELNAVGYVSSQDLVYGIGDHGHLYRIDRSGGIRDLGYPAGVPRGGLALATAGAALGGTLVVRLDDRLLTIDVAPSSRTYLSVTRVVRMRPGADGLDDFAVDPVDGLFYGVNATHGRPTVVSVDPSSGTVRVVATPDGLPAHGSSYGAAVIDSSRTLYVLDNDDGHRSRLFAIPRGGPAREVSSGPAVGTSDAAGCLGMPTPPPPPPPPPPPRLKTTTPPPPTTTTTTTTPPPPPPPPSPAPTSAVVVPPPSPQRPVVVPTKAKPWTAAQVRPAAAANHEERTKQRRWALTAVILLVGGGAATHAAARARHR